MADSAETRLKEARLAASDICAKMVANTWLESGVPPQHVLDTLVDNIVLAILESDMRLFNHLSKEAKGIGGKMAFDEYLRKPNANKT